MIIFGSKVRYKTVDRGQFYCPTCKTTRPYERKTGKKYFTLYFIPVIPMDSLGEIVECQTCGLAYKPEVLKLKATPLKLTLANMLNSTGKLLEEGKPVEYLVRDMTAAGLDREVALQAVNTQIGTERNVCPNCRLTYATDVTNCAECNHSLESYAE